MKKKLLTAFLAVSMLMSARVYADDAAATTEVAAVEVDATADAGNGTDVVAEDAGNGGAAKNGAFALITNFLNKAISPVNGVWADYPHAAGAGAAVALLWAMKETCPWFQNVIGCTKKRKHEDDLI